MSYLIVLCDGAAVCLGVETNCEEPGEVVVATRAQVRDCFLE